MRNNYHRNRRWLKTPRWEIKPKTNQGKSLTPTDPVPNEVSRVEDKISERNTAHVERSEYTSHIRLVLQYHGGCCTSTDVFSSVCRSLSWCNIGQGRISALLLFVSHNTISDNCVSNVLFLKQRTRRLHKRNGCEDNGGGRTTVLTSQDIYLYISIYIYTYTRNNKIQ